jgi:ferrous iron transport protein A
MQSQVAARTGKLMALSELGIGQDGIVTRLELPDDVQHHLMHMGFVPEARVTALRRAPAGDPTVYAIDGLEIALRRDTARSIRVRQSREVEAEDLKERKR